MSGRYRTVALQALGVAVIAAFIFVAFLWPSEPENLSGIDVPGGDDSPTVVTPPRGKNGNENGREKTSNRNHPHGASSDRPGASGIGTGYVGPPEAAGGDETLAPPVGDGGPGDDQYTDLVSLLMEQVGRPGLYKEIDDP